MILVQNTVILVVVIMVLVMVEVLVIRVLIIIGRNNCLVLGFSVCL